MHMVPRLGFQFSTFFRYYVHGFIDKFLSIKIRRYFKDIYFGAIQKTEEYINRAWELFGSLSKIVKEQLLIQLINPIINLIVGKSLHNYLNNFDCNTLETFVFGKNSKKICSSWKVIRGGREFMPVHYLLGWSNVQFLERIGVLDYRERAQVRPAIIIREVNVSFSYFKFIYFSILSNVQHRLHLFRPRFPFSHT